MNNSMPAQGGSAYLPDGYVPADDYADIMIEARDRDGDA